MCERIRGILADRRDVSEKEMFGGIAFMIRGNMCVSIVKDDLMVRVGPEEHEELVQEPHVHPMDFSGRPMKGFLYVASLGLDADEDLERWVGYGLKHAMSLPAKVRKRLPPNKALQRTRDCNRWSLAAHPEC